MDIERVFWWNGKTKLQKSIILLLKNQTPLLNKKTKKNVEPYSMWFSLTIFLRYS